MKTKMPHRRTAGFTLLEMLVVLLLFGLVASLLGQTLFLISRVESNLGRLQNTNSAQVLQREWVRQTLASLAPTLNGEMPFFSGEPQALGALCATPPWPGLSGPRWITLQLRPRDKATELWVSTVGKPELLLASWQGAGRLEYLDRATDKWLERWQPQPEGEFKLPAAIRLTDAPPEMSLLVPLLATHNPRLLRKDFD